MLIAIQNSIQNSENIPQPAFPNIEFLSIRTKTTPFITVGVVYAPPKIKISSFNLDLITSHNGPGHYIIDDDLNAKHLIWNNFRRNKTAPTMLSSEIIKLSTVQPTPTSNCTPSNIDIFLSNMPYCHTTDDLSSNYLLVSLSF